MMKKHIDTAMKLRRMVGVAHHIPGRVRLKYKLGIIAHLASLNKQDIEQYLADIPALKNYTLNSATGSIVIEYDAAMINPVVIEALFSDSDSDAEQACRVLGRCIDANGVL